MNLTLFDLDGTLLPIDSDHAFGEFVVGLGWADAQQHRLGNDAFYADYQAGRLNIDDYVDFATAPWRNRTVSELDDAMAAFLAQVAQPALRDSALSLVRRHQQAGDQVVIVTATVDFITRPIARLFGVDELIATELVRSPAGRVTGAILGVPAFRQGKVGRVQSWMAAAGVSRSSYERVSFYSDSTNDLPLLEWVSHPVATNPGPALERLALERNWPVLKLFN